MANIVLNSQMCDFLEQNVPTCVYINRPIQYDSSCSRVNI